MLPVSSQCGFDPRVLRSKQEKMYGKQQPTSVKVLQAVESELEEANVRYVP